MPEGPSSTATCNFCNCNLQFLQHECCELWFTVKRLSGQVCLSGQACLHAIYTLRPITCNLNAASWPAARHPNGRPWQLGRQFIQGQSAGPGSICRSLQTVTTSQQDTLKENFAARVLETRVAAWMLICRALGLTKFMQTDLTFTLCHRNIP